jgi:hypothetical protein
MEKEQLLLKEANVPLIPDPTLLTTAALKHEIALLKELITTRLDSMDKAQSLFEENLSRVPTDTDKQISHLKELHDSKFLQLESSLAMSLNNRELAVAAIGVRLDGMDKAVDLLQVLSDKVMEKVDEKIHSLKDIHEEKFGSIQVQFRERDVRTEQSSKDSKVAIDAALQAAKDAVGEQNKSSALAIAKSEASTIKQIDQMTLMIQVSNKGVDDKFDDVKERLTRIEGKNEGKTTEGAERHTSTALNVAIAAVIISFVGLVVAIFIAVSHGGATSAVR